MDAQIMSSKEEYAFGMGQHRQRTSISEGCRNLVNEEDYSGDTANTASITKNLQLSHCVLDLNLIRLLR